MDILLVHGAWHGAWCWSRLIPELGRRGVDAVAIDLPGHGNSSTEIGPITLSSYADAISAAAEAAGAPPLLVGHSMGGVAISAAAERSPSAFRSLAYLTAFLPLDGQALFDLTAELGAASPGRVENGCSILERKQAQAMFYSDCAANDAAWALERIQPEPLAPAAEPVRLSAERYGSVARDYIVCTGDAAIPAEFQRAMAERAHCRRIEELDSGHSPFLACPQALADTLLKLMES